MVFSFSYFSSLWEGCSPAFRLFLFSFCCILVLYFITLILLYSLFLRFLVRKNLSSAKDSGVCIAHCFSYSWKNGVTLTVIHLGPIEPKCKCMKEEKDNENENENENKTVFPPDAGK
jgi:hypothetical protein